MASPINSSKLLTVLVTVLQQICCQNVVQKFNWILCNYHNCYCVFFQFLLDAVCFLYLIYAPSSTKTPCWNSRIRPECELSLPVLTPSTWITIMHFEHIANITMTLCSMWRKWKLDSRKTDFIRLKFLSLQEFIQLYQI